MQIQDHKKNGMQHALPKFSTIFSSDFYVARILLLSFLLLTVQEIQRHTLIFSVFNKPHMEFSHLICSQATASKWDPWIVWTCPLCLSKSTEVNLKVLFATENTASQPFREHHTYNNQIKCI